MKDIEGFEGLYAVTEDGRVWSYPKWWGGKLGNQNHNGKWIIQETLRRNYKRVTLRKNGKVKRITVHRLVAFAYLPIVAGKNVVNHLDGDPSNNHVNNLEWCTTQENGMHSSKMGRTQRGTKNNHNVLNEDEVREIRKMYSAGITQPEIGRIYGITQSAVHLITSRKNWYWLD